ncbi:YcjF family protein [Nisaea nitritireducens]|uniref:YcjF family protein n=1 Tax=Nisaea nitritireducens TaxID=568392 RepID=UPI0018684A29|nr:DUF697 domain-containing protein [Nisaea nitritireducens]
MTEDPNNTQDLKREIARLKRETKATERERQNAKKAIDAANAHRQTAETEAAARRETQAARDREAKALQRRVESANRTKEKLKKESADRDRELKRLESSLRQSQAQADGLQKELKTRTEKSGQPNGQVGTAVTGVAAARSDDREKRIPSKDRDIRKEVSAMTAQTDAGNAAKTAQAGQPDPDTDAKNTNAGQPDEGHLVKYELAKTQLLQQDRLKANRIVATYSAIGAGVGVIPFVVVDIAGLATVQLMMLSRLAQLYKVPFSGNLGRTLLSAVLGAIIPTTLKTGTIGLIRSIPLFGQLLGFVAMPTYSWMVTYAIGTVFTDIFEQNKDLDSVSIEETTARVKKVMNDLATKEKAEAATAQQAA